MLHTHLSIKYINRKWLLLSFIKYFLDLLSEFLIVSVLIDGNYSHEQNGWENSEESVNFFQSEW